MPWYKDNNTTSLNFMIVGHFNSGYGLLQSALNQHSQIVCHGDILHADSKIRKQEHEQYFGDSGKVPDWFVQGSISVEQYLNNKIFDNALHEEKAVGVKLNYRHFMDYDLWDYTNQKYRKGDFCLVHVTRNPLACYLAYRQSQTRKPAIFLDEQELIDFVRFHEAAENKINRLSRDRVVVPYRELVLNYEAVLKNVLEFLELEPEPCSPYVLPLVKPNVFQRISNWAILKDSLPADVRQYIPGIF